MTHVEYTAGTGDYLDRARLGYLGPIRIPLALADRLIVFEVKWKYRFNARFRPHVFFPQDLYGYDGEPPYFLRLDLAHDRSEVLEFWTEQWGWESFIEAIDCLTPPNEIRIVWMKESPDSREYEDGWYDKVDANTPGSMPYWMWSE